MSISKLLYASLHMNFSFMILCSALLFIFLFNFFFLLKRSKYGMKLLRLCLAGFLCNEEKEYKLNN